MVDTLLDGAAALELFVEDDDGAGPIIPSASAKLVPIELSISKLPSIDCRFDFFDFSDLLALDDFSDRSERSERSDRSDRSDRFDRSAFSLHSAGCDVATNDGVDGSVFSFLFLGAS